MTQPISTVQPYNGPQKAAKVACQQYLATNGTEGVLFEGEGAWEDSSDIVKKVNELFAPSPSSIVGVIFDEKIQTADGRFCTGVCIVAQPYAITTRL